MSMSFGKTAPPHLGNLLVDRGLGSLQSVHRRDLVRLTERRFTVINFLNAVLHSAQYSQI